MMFVFSTPIQCLIQLKSTLIAERVNKFHTKQNTLHELEIPIIREMTKHPKFLDLKPEYLIHCTPVVLVLDLPSGQVTFY